MHTAKKRPKITTNFDRSFY